MMIDPGTIAFDIDSVVADTMGLFLDIAREEFQINRIRYEDITSYTLDECIDMDPKIIAQIVTILQEGSYSVPLRPIEGAPEVLTRLSRSHAPILFVTARPYLGPIHDWLLKTLSIEPAAIQAFATGTYDGKADVLKDKGIGYFVEDRLETCYSLNEAGIIPILFRQPWNRKRHPFTEVGTWRELESLIKF
jgi:5'(3')-deoxyribonucleotidase